MGWNLALADTFRADDFLDELATLVAFPSVSSDPAYRDGVLDCASWLQSRLEGLPGETRRIETKGYPLIVARMEKDASYPTVAVYNHYDVQPIAAPDEWRTDPFALSVEGDLWYGRGATDDKGNLVSALYAVELALERELKVNIEVIYEGEEEVGSRHFRQGLERCLDWLNPDCILVADGKWLSPQRPCIYYGTRGLLVMHWDLKTAERGGHSGTLGGAARNPLAELMAAFSQCYDPKTMRILVPGVYDKLREPTDAEVRGWMEAAIEPEELMAAYALRDIRTRDTEALVRAVLGGPTFEVHGCVGGYMKKDGKMTVIPSEGQLQLSMRLAPDQDPDEVFEQVRSFVGELNPDIDVRKAESCRCYSGDPNSKAIRAGAKAVQETFGLPVGVSRMGATVGALAEMADVFGAPPTFMMGFSLSEHCAHAPNEYFERRQAEGGVEAMLRFLRSMEASDD